jgi:zinc transport system substrate-binding protein
MLRKVLITALLLVGLAGGVWTLMQASVPKTARLQVTASFYPLFDFAQQVGGDLVQLTTVTPAGAEPHDFEPSAKALVAARKAQVFIYNGGTLEPWTGKFIEQYSGVVVKASSNVPLREGESGKDPHFWLDPVLAQQVVNSIRDGLSKADPEHAEIYRQHASAYNQQLAVLDQEYQQGLRQCTGRTVVTSHQAMGYLAARYNVRVEAIAGLSPESEPSAARLAELTRIVKQENIGYIFFESLVSPRLAATIATETGAKTAVFDPIEGLTDEAQKTGKNYLSVQRENLRNLRLALACQ